MSFHFKFCLKVSKFNKKEKTKKDKNKSFLHTDKNIKNQKSPD